MIFISNLPELWRGRSLWFLVYRSSSILCRTKPFFPTYYIAMAPSGRNFNNHQSSKFIWDWTFPRTLSEYYEYVNQRRNQLFSYITDRCPMARQRLHSLCVNVWGGHSFRMFHSNSEASCKHIVEVCNLVYL